MIINKTTPLKHQLRSMDIFPSKDGFAVGSIEGRVAIEMIDNNEAKKKNFSFKCHRHPVETDKFYLKDNEDDKEKDDNNYDKDQQNIYGVNCIKFHPNGTFITGGGDGEIDFWDRIQRSRLKHLERMKSPIVAAGFNYNATKLAYCTSYDWSKGEKGYNEKIHKPQIYIHDVDLNNNVQDNNNNNTNTITGSNVNHGFASSSVAF